MAQETPLRNRAIFGAGKWLGRAGGTAGLATEAVRLGQIDAEQGPEAMRAEIPRSAGRLGGAWLGAKGGAALGAATGPLAPYAVPAGAIVGGAAGYAFGDDAVDAARSGMSRLKSDVFDAKPPADFRTRKVSVGAPTFGGSGFGAPMTPAAITPAVTAAAPRSDMSSVSPARNRPGNGWRAPMQLPAGSKPEGWSPQPLDIPNGKPKQWNTPMQLPADYPKAPASQRSTAEDAMAARYGAPPERATAYGFQDANKAEAAGMRSAARIQDYGNTARSTITGNMLDGMRGDTAELQRRMYNDLTSYSLKGFPGLRAQRAEMWRSAIDAANGVTAKGADNAAAADTQGMQDANTSQRAFSERKNKVDMFNTATSEDRRSGDLNRAVEREGNMLSAAARAAGKEQPPFADRLYEDYLAVTKDPQLAAQMANRGSVAAGEVEDTPINAMARTGDMDRLAGGASEFSDRWFGFGNRKFDPASAQVADTAGILDSWLPGGVAYGDLRLKDANGNETWAPPSALPAGETLAEYQMRARRQQRLAAERGGN